MPALNLFNRSFRSKTRAKKSYGQFFLTEPFIHLHAVRCCHPGNTCQSLKIFQVKIQGYPCLPKFCSITKTSPDCSVRKPAGYTFHVKFGIDVCPLASCFKSTIKFSYTAGYHHIGDNLIFKIAVSGNHLVLYIRRIIFDKENITPDGIQGTFHYFRNISLNLSSGGNGSTGFIRNILTLNFHIPGIIYLCHETEIKQCLAV